jgi:signal recognition particle GTPase
MLKYLNNMKSLIKNLLGPKIIYNLAPIFHGVKGYLTSIAYGRPASKMILVGITGTKGKTTTTMQLGRILNLHGIKTGFLSTGSIYLGEADVSELTTIENLKTKFGPENIEKFLNQ